MSFCNDVLILFIIEVFNPLKLKSRLSIFGLPKVKALILPSLAYLSINGPPGYFSPKTFADLSNASPAASSSVEPIIFISL